MPEAALQEYLQEINRLIEESHLREAVRHCRHLLKQFPRHVETYRLMGKALLEQGELGAANDVFQRVLSADPEDFIAHAGIAIIRKQENRLSDAAWHMERAFEVEPYNSAIREALQDIVGRRDGLPPERVSLTRAALARLYVRGELYPQAISELRELLEEQPDRVDLQVLLAEALWRDGQRIDAANDCTRILELLPNCVKVNAILAEVSLVTDRPDEADQYLQRAFEMVLPTADTLRDDTVVALVFKTEGGPTLPERITVDRAGADGEAGSAIDVGDWVNDLDFGEELAMEDVEPEWLGALQHESAPAASELEESDTDSERDAEREIEYDADAVAAGTSEEEATNWFRRSSSDRLPGIGELREETDWEAWLENDGEEAAASMPASPDNSSDVEEVGMGTMDEQGRNEDEFPEADEPQQFDAPSSGGDDDSQEWLDELQEASAPTQPSELEGLDEGGLPDWLREGIDLDDVPAAELDRLDESEEGSAGDDSGKAAAQAEELPDWLRDDLEGEGEGGAAVFGDDLSWLDQIAAGEGPALEEPPTMSWPESESSSVESARQEEAMPHEEPGIGDVEASSVDETAMPAADDDVEAGGFDDDVPEDLDEAMAWLEQLAAQQGAPEEELPSLSADRPAEGVEPVAEEVPEDLGEAMDWLDELAHAEDEAEYEPLALTEADDGDDFSDDEEVWLGELGSEESQDLEYDDFGDVEMETGIGRAEFESEAIESPAEAEPEELSAEYLATQSQVPEEDDVPEDLEDAMAWLEQLAAQQGAPVEELPSMREQSSESAPEVEVERDPTIQEQEVDAAMAWLEQLTAEGATGDEISAWEDLEDAPDMESLAELGEIPDDPELALAWLEELAGVSESTTDEDVKADVVEEQATPSVPHDLVAARAEAEAILLHDTVTPEEEGQEGAILEDIPDDPDEAMAWLERLAARQGAPLDELPSMTEVEEEEEVAEPDSMGDDVVEFESGDEPGVPEIVEDTSYSDDVEREALDAGEFEELPEALETADIVEGEADAGEEFAAEEVEEPEFLSEMDFADESVEEELPDWLALDDESEMDDFAWEEQSFDPTGWLEAEESALQTEEPVADEHADMTEQLEEVEAAADSHEFVPEQEVEEAEALPAEELVTVDEELETADEEEEAVEPITAETEWEPEAEELPEMDVSPDVAEAWQALESGEVDVAVAAYQDILGRGEDVASLISQLERATQEFENQPALFRLLGDAYNQNGQLQKALDAYRQALALL